MGGAITKNDPDSEMRGLEALTVRERKFFFLYVEKGTLLAAARSMANYKNKNTAAQAGHKYWQNIKRKVDVEMLMEEVGLSKVRIFRKLDEGLEATFVKPMSRTLPGDKAGAEIVECGPYIDHPTRVKAATEAAKIAGLVVEKHEVAGPGGGPIAHAVAEMSEDALRALAGGRDRGAGKTPAD